MGARGIKRRKRRRPLAKVRGQLQTPEANQATALSPMGAVQAYGNILRATRSPHPRQRRAGLVLGLLIALPLAITGVVAFVVLATH